MYVEVELEACACKCDGTLKMTCEPQSLLCQRLGDGRNESHLGRPFADPRKKQGLPNHCLPLSGPALGGWFWTPEKEPSGRARASRERKAAQKSRTDQDTSFFELSTFCPPRNRGELFAISKSASKLFFFFRSLFYQPHPRDFCLPFFLFCLLS